MKLPSLRFRPVKNEPVVSEHVRRDHDSGGLLCISRSMNSISKAEPFWGVPGNSRLAIKPCGSSCGLPVFLNGANPHAPGVPLIPIGPIYSNGGNRDATRPVN